MGADLSINLTAVVVSMLTAATNGVAVLLATRYMAKVIDKIEDNKGDATARRTSRPRMDKNE